MINADESFLLERYKWILERRRDLNNNTFKITALYQTSLAFILSGEFAVLSLGKSSELFIQIMLTKILWSVFVVFSLFAMLLLCSGIKAWIGYRLDEIKIERIMGLAPRDPPKLSQALSWYETYIIILIAFLLISGSVIFYDLTMRL